MQNQMNRFLYAIDKYWLTLQKSDEWYLIVPLKVIQKEGYSDIEKRVVNYNSLMKNINKSLTIDNNASLITDNNKFTLRNVM